MRFSNPYISNLRRKFLDVILWKTGYYDDLKHYPKAPASFTYPVVRSVAEADKPSAMWINHSTFLIKVKGLNILTDPIWSSRCSPLSFLGPKRRHSPPLELDDLPSIDLVLISHNHYDHLDKATVLALYAKFPHILWLVPLGVKKWFTRLGIENVLERSWWESIDLEMRGIEIKATAVPTQHFSGRSPFDFNKTLWAGWVVNFTKGAKFKKQLYFVGDTGYNPYDFKKIGQTFGSMDLSLIPIGTYVPRKFMSPVHIEPKNAVRIHKEVHSVLSLGMHWKTFNLSDEPFNQPPYDLLKALQKEEIDPSAFLAIETGHSINW